MKRFLICLLCFLMVASSASAQINKPVADSNLFELTLSGKSNIINSVISVVITKPGITIEDVTVSDILNQTIFVYEIETAADGSWNRQINLPVPADESGYGVYTVYVKGEDAQNFYLASSTEIQEAVDDIKEATPDTLYGILEDYTIEKEILPLDLTGVYVDYTDTEPKTTFVNNAIIKFVREKENMTGNDVTVAFNKAIEAARYAYGTADEVEKALTNNILEIEFDDEVDKSELAETYTSLDFDATDDATELYTNIRCAEALLKVNSATKGEMTDIFEEYNDVLELDLDGDYDDVNKVNVNKELIGEGFKTLDELRDAFDDAVDKIKDSKKKSSGGGSSGGSSGSTVKKVDIYAPDVKEEVKDDSSSVKFNDISNVEWAKDYILELASKGIVNGISANEYAPLKVVTREEYIKMLVGAFKIQVNGGKTYFADVDENAWYAPYISWAVENGIINGISANEFGVGTPVTREQMAVIAVRMMEKFGINLEAADTSFIDFDSISDYAKESIGKIYKAEIINGMPDGSFMPKESLNRAQAAKVICLIMKAGDLSE